MNYDFFKKIPFFKNLDFTDAKDRKSALMVIAVILGIILLITFNVIKSSDKKKDDKKKEEARQEIVKSNLPEIPEGEDNEILDAENVEDMHANAKRQAISNINELFFSEGTSKQEPQEENDPIALLNGEDPDKASFHSSDRLSARRHADEFFGLTDENGVDNKNGDGSPRDNVFGQNDRQGNTTQDNMQRISDLRASMTQDGYAPEDYARRTRGGGYSEPEPQEAVYEAAPEPEPEPVKIRKTGTLSGFDDEWGNLSTGVKGLDDRTQYITSGDIKPVKVAFIKEERLQSGQRVTLRLLEDMYADGVIIQKNSHLSATCQIGNRLTLTVSNVEVNGQIHDLNCVAIDNDGNEGLYCPQTQSQEVKDQLVTDAQSITRTALTSALGGAGSAISSLVNSGAQVVSTVSGKKTATVSSGYTFYLVQKKN